MLRCFATCRLPPALVGGAAVSRRQQAAGSDQYHHFLDDPEVIQSDSVDTAARVKNDQQMWNNTEQWNGYSDTYLTRFAQYPSTFENANGIEHQNPLLNRLLHIAYAVYGDAAEILEELENDPLHPDFHNQLNSARDRTLDLAKKIDDIYAPMHPTEKTMVDALLVRRWHTLQDWQVTVTKKRAAVLDALSPEFMAQQVKSKGVVAQHLARLKQMEDMINRDPVLLMGQDVFGLNEEELVVARQKARFFHKSKMFGKSFSQSEVNSQ
jgi:hypothetical protein